MVLGSTVSSLRILFFPFRYSTYRGFWVFDNRFSTPLLMVHPNTIFRPPLHRFTGHRLENYTPAWHSVLQEINHAEGCRLSAGGISRQYELCDKIDFRKPVLEVVSNLGELHNCQGSWSAWHVEDHDFHSLNYMHMGAAKTWYGVPRDAAVAFEDVITEHAYGGEINPIAGTDLEAHWNVEKSSESTSQLTPNASHVESLLTQICDSTSIAEVEIKGLDRKKHTTPPPSATAPASGETVEAIDQNSSAPSTSLAITKAVPTSGGIQTFLDRAADDGLVIVQSPRVGYFRRSRAIKGKRALPSCKEKQIVKEGQVICYVEQLGGDLPIEVRKTT
ncbi:hypothetical protein L1887_00184 [Cichorium endivia]|nr:hypothetical protein L1887_00184 [Cichorium endivia]